MPTVGDVMLSDLYHFLKSDEPRTSQICAFMLGLLQVNWKKVKSAKLGWRDVYKQYEETTEILPTIHLEFYEESE